MFRDADVVARYTRADAIRDGILIDASVVAIEAGIRYPVALTRAAWERCVRVPSGTASQDEIGRLWDVLTVLCFTICGSNAGTLVRFAVYVAGRPQPLKAVCGPGDQGEPVITIMLPDED